MFGACIVVGTIAKCRIDRLDMRLNLDAFPWANRTASIASIGLGILLMLLLALSLGYVPAEQKDSFGIAALFTAAVTAILTFKVLRSRFPSNK